MDPRADAVMPVRDLPGQVEGGGTEDSRGQLGVPEEVASQHFRGKVQVQE